MSRHRRPRPRPRLRIPTTDEWVIGGPIGLVIGLVILLIGHAR